MPIVTSHDRSDSATSAARTDWQQAVKSAIRDPAQLCRLLDLPEKYIHQAEAAARDFPLFAPRAFVARMKSGDPRDPLLRQVLPLADELLPVEGFTSDPVGDGVAATSPGLLHKYRGRALLIAAGACAVHCRYCFRRHFPYGEAPKTLEQHRQAIQQIAADDSIEEIILSGGDPLMLTDRRLTELVAALAEVPHLRRLRIHTRLPIVIPQRITDDLLSLLSKTRLTPVVVVHANHPAELGTTADDPVAAALSRLIDAGIVVLNQSVLLRGVNDDADVLTALSQRLIELRVLPYYLHQLDRVTGAAHFEVPILRGQELIAQLRARLPGYAVPRYVQEIAGQANKQVLA